MELIDIAIIGGGPAGMSAAIYALRCNKKTVIFEAKSFGGQIVNASRVENYPGIANINGFDFAMRLYEQVTGLGGEFVFEKVEQVTNEGSIKLIKTNGSIYQAKSVIIATGTQKAVLGLENEKKYVGKGVSYCATCDGAFFKQKEVAVVGGGSTALEDALFLAEYCSKVYMIHRRDYFTGEEKYVDELKQRENVEFLMESEVTALMGEEMLEGFQVTNRITKESRIIEIAGVFVAIGQNPDNMEFANIVELNDKGYIIADESCSTAMEGVFVAGDCRDKKVRQLTTAAADGAVAALAASTYVAGIK